MADKREAEAAGWVARLQSRDATEEDRRRFEIWLGQHPDHHALYESFRSLWGDLKQVPLPPDQLKKLRRKKRLSSAGGVAALLMAVAVSTSAFRMGYVDRWQSDYYTIAGEVRSVELQDGSYIDLNTDTAIAVHYTEQERRIVILRGEAFFDVAHNPDRPFIVQSGGLTATALGTHYAVRTDTGGAEEMVQVQEGRVEVTSSRDHAVLTAGEVAELDGQDLQLSRQDVDAQTAWRDGKLIFSGQPLQEVLATLARYRNGRIVVVGSDVGSQKVSGIFDVHDTDAALDSLAQNLDVRVTRLTNMLVLVTSR